MMTREEQYKKLLDIVNLNKDYINTVLNVLIGIDETYGKDTYISSIKGHTRDIIGKARANDAKLGRITHTLVLTRLSAAFIKTSSYDGIYSNKDKFGTIIVDIHNNINRLAL